MDILRFITAGNIDDGKSTLIGRLLHDSNNIKTDVLQSIQSRDAQEINFAHITDGLRQERQYGITVDVGYKFFTTKNRKYIITDAPGHFQYTKNLVTGASSVDVMIILIDATRGITEQTKRHSLVASFLKTNHVVIAINKMDLLNYDERSFDEIKVEYEKIAERIQLQNIDFIPISALVGDNVCFNSENMSWYKGKTLMQYLETCEPTNPGNDITRVSIQYAIGTVEKGYLGLVLSGIIKVNDIVRISPERKTMIVREIVQGYSSIRIAQRGENICLFLSDMQNDTKIERGDIVANLINEPQCNNRFEATICWLDAYGDLQVGKEYFLKINSKETVCRISELMYKIDVNNFEKKYANGHVIVNEYAKVIIETQDIIAFDSYDLLPENGRGIIIDTATNSTSGAFVIN